MKYILYIDTSGDTCLTAISGDGKLLAEKKNEEVRNHASVINNDIEAVLKIAGISIQELNAIAVCGGPGSYTGLRIGLATAKGICYVKDIPLMLHNKLTILAHNAWLNKKDKYMQYYASYPARANEFFIAGYDNNFEEIVKPQHSFIEELALHTLNNTSCITGIFEESTLAHIKLQGADHIDQEKINIDSWIVYSTEQYNCNGFVSIAHAEPYYLKNVYTHKPKNNK